MKFDPNCVRELLLLVENGNILINEGFTIDRHEFDEISSCANKCNRAGLFIGYEEYIDRSIYIEDLSISGHQILAEIRDNSRWKQFLKTVKPVALSCIESLLPAILADQV